MACLWEGVALRSALGVSARAACPGASVDVAPSRARARTTSTRAACCGCASRWTANARSPLSQSATKRAASRETTETTGRTTEKEKTRRRARKKKKGFSDDSRRARRRLCVRFPRRLQRPSPRARTWQPPSWRRSWRRDWTRRRRRAPRPPQRSHGDGGERAVVLGDVPASETLAGVVDGLSRVARRRLHARLGSRRDARVHLRLRVRKAAQQGDVAAARADSPPGKEKSADSGAARPAPAALTDALVTRRDARLFDAAWSVAARSAAAPSVPAYARVASVAAPPEPFARTRSKSWDPSRLLAPGEVELSRERDRAMVIVAVVGAAHVEGIARRWREKSAKELASCDT